MASSSSSGAHASAASTAAALAAAAALSAAATAIYYRRRLRRVADDYERADGHPHSNNSEIEGNTAAAALSSAPTALLASRPASARGAFLRLLVINDAYILDNLPRFAGALDRARASAALGHTDDPLGPSVVQQQQEEDGRASSGDSEDFAASEDREFTGAVVLGVHAGDFLSPTLFTSLDGGVTMAQALCAATVDVAGLGNHEFDLSPPDLRAALHWFHPQSPAAASAGGEAAAPPPMVVRPSAARGATETKSPPPLSLRKSVASQLSAKHTGVILNSNVDNPELADLPRFALVAVGRRTGVLTAAVVDDPSIYNPASTPDARPVTASHLGAFREVAAALSGTPDLFVPITHQLTPHDRQTALEFAQHPDVADRTPVIVAGHDHEVFIEEAGKSLICKVGCDAQEIGVIDIWWDSDGKLQRSVALFPAGEFAEAPLCREFVSEKQAFMESMMGVPIVDLPGPMTSKRTRFEESSMATFLLTLVKRGLRRHRVDLVLLQGGAVRADANYEAGPFSLGDLFKELAFDCHQAIIPVRGDILAASIKATRVAPKPSPMFLHFDGDAEADAEHNLTKINGQPLVADKIYTVSIYQLLLTGLNVIEPLLTYVRENVTVPDEEACIPIKEVVLDQCMRQAWHELFDLTEDECAKMHAEDFARRIDEIFDEMDTNADGSVDKSELTAFVAARRGGRQVETRHTGAFVDQLLKHADTDHDGAISREELHALACF